MYVSDGFGDAASAVKGVATAVGAVTNPFATLATAITDPVNAVKSLARAFGIGPAPADQAAWASFGQDAHFQQVITNNKTTAAPAAAANQIGTTVDSAVKQQNGLGVTFQAPFPFTVRIGVRDPARIYNGSTVVQDLAPPGPGNAAQAANATLSWLGQYAKGVPAAVPAAGAAVPPTPAAQQTPAVPAATDLTSILSRLFPSAPASAPASTTVTVAPGAAAPAQAPIQAGMPGWLLPVALGGILLFVTQSNQSTGRRR
jgi:hypothetical protein